MRFPPPKAHGGLGEESPMVATRDGGPGRTDSSESAHPLGAPLSLPKGGGAVRGIGEKFAANPVTGTGSLSVPIATSPGRSGFGPRLALTYDSNAGNGPWGRGWRLDLPGITRKTDKGLPRYLDAEQSDCFILSGAEDLVPVPSPGAVPDPPDFAVQRYRPRIEGLFARIERWTRHDTGSVHWRSMSPDNITTLYGLDDASRIVDPATPGHIFGWLICQSYDARGNAILYDYVPEDGRNVDLGLANERNRVRTAHRYLKRIRYGNRTSRLVEPDLGKQEWCFEVVFDYDEAHYHPIPLDPALPDREQHRYVRASATAGTPWSSRPDPFSDCRPGFEVRLHRRCHRVLSFHRFEELGPEPCLVRATEFNYADLDYADAPDVDRQLTHQGSTRLASCIRSVTQSGFVREPDRDLPVPDGRPHLAYRKKSLPPLEFEYSAPGIQDRLITPDAQTLENLPSGVDGKRCHWVDLDGVGLPGALTEQADDWWYKPNLGGGRLGPARRVAPKPVAAALSRGTQLLDLAGDGTLDLVRFSGPAPGFFGRTGDGGWSPFQELRHLPALDWDDPNLRLVDLDGDGHPDVLLTTAEELTWYRSLGEQGFEPRRSTPQAHDEETGPRLLFADGTQSVYLADMSGDGLAADLVRIRNGEISYYPSLGHGRYGPRVVMDDAPRFDHPDHFDQRRIRLLDVDGSGTDILYLGRDGARLYLNQSGNRWSAARPLRALPPITELATLTTADLLGQGTACLVWSSAHPTDARRTLRYVDLLGGQRPHLLIASRNNLGAETRVTYAASTRFWLEDQRAGTPWITRVPFPVHVVERIETLDRVSGNRFVSTFRYSDGFYDGEEREWRGFGRVDQEDTAEYATLAGATNADERTHVPPVHTRSWYHTGAWFGRGRISKHLAGEYFQEPGLEPPAAAELLLADTVLPPDLSLPEEREACRALKGSLLRQEVYALDRGARAPLPYLVLEQSFGVRCLQRRGDNQHGVFLAYPLESLRDHYERSIVAVDGDEIVEDARAADPGLVRRLDPRTTHQVTLEVDDFGNVVDAVTIGYGRRWRDRRLPSDTDRSAQRATLITRTRTAVTNAVDGPDDYHVPLAAEVTAFDLTGYIPTGLAGRFVAADFAVTDRTLAYEATPTGGRERRIIEQSRTRFRPDDLGVAAGDPAALLPLGALEARALAGDSWRLTFTAGLVARTFGARLTDALLSDAGGYVHSEGDDAWWIPSGRVYYSPGSADDASHELAHARAHFFLPHRFRDPFHRDAFRTEGFVDYDGYDLLVRETRDALGNRVTAGARLPDETSDPAAPAHNYRVLQPELVTDPNRNQTQAIFDAFGLVVATAVMGKRGVLPAVGDGIPPDYPTDLTEKELTDFLADPRGGAAALLGDATTRIIYDLDAFTRGGAAVATPAVVATLARETHLSEPVPAEGLQVQLSFTYSDGFGREIQKKIPAEDGADHAPRWVGSGWTVYNNKGKPVRQFEPFFTATHRFESDARVGVSPILCYDPMDRVVATLRPDHAWEKVAFDPWCQTTWDANDTVAIADPRLDPIVGDYFARLATADVLPTWSGAREGGALGAEEQAAAVRTGVHADTPLVVHADALGRAFLTIAQNRAQYSDGAPPVAESAESRLRLDIEGNQREVRDAKGRLIMRYDYDMLGQRTGQESMEAGERWAFQNVLGRPVAGWGSRGHRLRTTYDPLGRPTETLLQSGNAAELTVARTVYGESAVAPEDHNLRGKPTGHYDQSGVQLSDAYDFKGNLLAGRRRIATVYDAILDWSGNVALEPETWLGSTRYDALNRPIQLVPPHSDQGGRVNVIQPEYNRAGLLERIDLWLDTGAEPAGLLAPDSATLHAVSNIDHDARGQRTRIVYGNGVTTDYGYDPLTYRLRTLLTRRGAGKPLQDLHYCYDPAGNITTLRDDAQQDAFFRNALVDPSADYTYDAVYRLIEATGREHLGQVGGNPTPHSYNDAGRTRIAWADNDGDAMGRYLERYRYDAVGNFSEMEHRPKDPGRQPWTRSYTYDEVSQLEPAARSNRLTSTTVNGGPERYSNGGDGYDAHGNLLRMPQLQEMQWDFRDQLRMSRRQAVNDQDVEGNAAAGERTWYVYDSSGERVRKVTETAPGAIKDERIYLGGFELFRSNTGARVARETLHLMDDRQRIALVETRTRGAEPGVPSPFIRFQYSDHLGTALLELDENAAIVSYESYAPYGSTSYQAVRSRTETPKRYRYTAKERDEESGLYYHGARYYAPWLGRWTATDPPGIVDGFNLYSYVRGNPVRFADPTGNYSWSKFGSDVWAGVKGVAEPALIVADFGQMGAALVTKEFFPSHYHDVEWLSGTGKSFEQNPNAGLGERVVQTLVEPEANLVSGGAFGLVKNTYLAVASGDPEKAQSILVQGAAGQVAGVGLAAVGSRASGRGWTGRGPARTSAESRSAPPEPKTNSPRAETPADEAIQESPQAGRGAGRGTAAAPSETALTRVRVHIAERLQQTVDTQNSRLANAIRNGNTGFLRNLGLSARTIRQLLSGTGRRFAAAYGRALERAVSRAIRSDPELSGQFEHIGNRSGVATSGRGRPDFRGRVGSEFQGWLGDLTTTAGRAAHYARYYGERMLVLTYDRLITRPTQH